MTGADGDIPNYCAGPATGRPLAPRAVPRDARLLTADTNSVYYAVASGNPTHAKLIRVPLDPRCG